eukprot:6256293-Prymnesium_polylepis.1
MSNPLASPAPPDRARPAAPKIQSPWPGVRKQREHLFARLACHEFSSIFQRSSGPLPKKGATLSFSGGGPPEGSSGEEKIVCPVGSRLQLLSSAVRSTS